jgi:hypothetical protein
VRYCRVWCPGRRAASVRKGARYRPATYPKCARGLPLGLRPWGHHDRLADFQRRAVRSGAGKYPSHEHPSAAGGPDLGLFLPCRRRASDLATNLVTAVVQGLETVPDQRFLGNCPLNQELCGPGESRGSDKVRGKVLGADSGPCSPPPPTTSGPARTGSCSGRRWASSTRSAPGPALRWALVQARSRLELERVGAPPDRRGPGMV